MNSGRMVVIAILAELIVTSLLLLFPRGLIGQGVQSLSSVEVCSYEGKDLSSLDDFLKKHHQMPPACQPVRLPAHSYGTDLPD